MRYYHILLLKLPLNDKYKYYTFHLDFTTTPLRNCIQTHNPRNPRTFLLFTYKYT